VTIGEALSDQKACLEFTIIGSIPPRLESVALRLADTSKQRSRRASCTRCTHFAQGGAEAAARTRGARAAKL